MKHDNPQRESRLLNATLIWIVLISIIMYFETLIRIFSDPTFSIWPSWLEIAFSISIATTLLAVLLLVSSKFWKAFWIMYAFIALLYGSQLFYYTNFRTFYTIFSLMNSSQITDFYREMFILLSRNAHFFFLIAIPVPLVLVLKRFVKSMQFHAETKATVLVGAGLMHILIVLVVLSGTQPLRQSYLTNLEITSSIDHFGLLTGMRIDAREYAKDILPFLEPNAAFIPDIIDPDKPPIDLEPEIEYNVFDIDWDALIANESSDVVKNMHEYFRSILPSNKNEYTGMFEGYNLIVITAEAFSHYAVDPKITPTLYMMANHGFVFENFYNPVWGVSTSDGEYVVLTGLIPKSGVWSLATSSTNNMLFTYGRQFEKLDYHTMAFHNHTYTYYRRHLSHPNLGYEYIGVGNGLNISRVWPPSDLEMVEETVHRYVDKVPFHTYYMTVSGHQFYTFSGNMMSYKNREAVSHLPYSTNVKAYLAAQIEFEKSMENLLQQLKDAGQYENTVIVISSDHYPYGLTQDEIEELAGKPIDQQFELYRSSLIIYNPRIEPTTISRYTSSLDILPTVSNLFGLDYDSRLMAGTDIFSEQPEIVIFNNRSFIIKEGRYNARTKEFTPHQGFEMIDKETLDKWIRYVNAKFYYSTKILEEDYYDIISRFVPPKDHGDIMQ